MDTRWRRARALVASVAVLAVAGCFYTEQPDPVESTGPTLFSIDGMIIDLEQPVSGSTCALAVSGSYDLTTSAEVETHQGSMFPGPSTYGTVDSVGPETITDHGIDGRFCVLRFSIDDVSMVSHKYFFIRVGGGLVASLNPDSHAVVDGSTVQITVGVDNIGTFSDPVIETL